MTALGFVAAAAAGTLLRVAAGAWANRDGFPWGTLAANVVGSFALGLLAGAGPAAAVILAAGALGSVTTFSTLAAEVVELWRHSHRRAMTYALVSLVSGVGAAVGGVAVVT